MRGCPLAILSAVIAVAAGCTAGCSSHARLEVISLQTGALYSTDFHQAYASRSEQGQYDVVLISQPAPAAAPARPDEVAEPGASPPLRHIVHMRVLWQPWSRPTSDNPALTNSSIHWHVINERADGGVDMLRYDGTGVVRVFSAGDEARIRIHSAKLEPGYQEGLSDPVGRASLRGAFVARISPRHVRQALAEISALAPAGTARAAR